jgi:cytosine/adenosine deaminase-related metal-dependent hydrolase
MYSSTEGMWEAVSEHEMKYKWSGDGGKAQFDKALAIIDQAISHNSGRLSGMMMPAQVDTCLPDLLKDSIAASTERGIPLQIHAAQLVTEFQEITRRHGVTPIKFLEQMGVIRPGTIVSHAIFLDHHDKVRFWGSQNDLNILAKSGASVAHCPTNYVRTWGVVMQDFGRYRANGINIGIGTDTFPHNMLEEMRLALMLCRAVSGRVEAVYTSDIFNAATIGGAKALQREDIGRLIPGAKADLVLLDLNQPSMKPIRDPLRSLIFQAADRAVRDVYVDGIKVVDDGHVLTLDYQNAGMKLDNVMLRMEKRLPELDMAKRNSKEISPLTFNLQNR